MSKAIKRLMKGKKISLFQTTHVNPMAKAPMYTEPDDFAFKAQLKCGTEISGTLSITDSIEKSLSKYASKDIHDLKDLIGETLYTIEVEFPTKNVYDADVSKNGKARFKVKDNTVVYLDIKPFKLVHASRRKDGKIGYVVRFLDDSCNDDVCFDDAVATKKLIKIPRILIGDDMKLNISELASDIVQYGYDHDARDKLIDAASIKSRKSPVIIATNDDDYTIVTSVRNCLPDNDDTGDSNTVENIDITEF